MATRKVTIKAIWDVEASVWVATSDDVPGLITESGSLDGLIAKLDVMVPELLELNARDYDESVEVPISLISERNLPVRRCA